MSGWKLSIRKTGPSPEHLESEISARGRKIKESSRERSGKVGGQGETISNRESSKKVWGLTRILVKGHFTRGKLKVETQIGI